jgi:putative cardiolipin synthase
MIKMLRLLILSVVLATVAGCASIDFDAPKSESFFISGTGDTTLGRELLADVAEHPPEQSGFYAVSDGIDSLALRLLLANLAERSIDAQYFLIHDDLVGKAFIDALLTAADRGGRVRLLIDDIQTKGYDEGLAALDSHENFEVRIFNPFANRNSRALDIANLRRVTRRMHNKSFTVDSQVTLIGGRNIADEYFDAREDEKFADLDVLAIGSVVNSVSDMFDSYWNHRASMPVSAFADAPEDLDATLASFDARISDALEDLAASKYADAVKSSILDFVNSDTNPFTWAEYDLVVDSPNKVTPKTNKESGTIMYQMRESIGEVQEELFVLTPYFVLRKEDVAAFRNLRQRNVNVTVVTNSLASNNHTVSHSGYTPNRKKLLEMGVKLYELRANTDLPSDESKGVQKSKSTLHGKVFSVDRKQIFIGSFNWNQRSINVDTELGVIIHSPEMATELVEKVIEGLPEQGYEVYLDDKNSLRWKGYDNGQEVILTKEPQTSFWHRFNAGFMRMLPIKSQL